MLNFDIFCFYLLLNNPNLTNSIFKDLYNKGLTSKLYTYEDFINNCRNRGFIK